ncbi:MAG: hypothetical protein ACK4MJ_04580, partial [Hylemonella sp.]
MTQQLQQIIETAWDDRASISVQSAPREVVDAVEHVIGELDAGQQLLAHAFFQLAQGTHGVLAVVFAGLMLLTSLVLPDFAAGFIDGLSENESDMRPLLLNDRATYLAAFVAVLSTWWILNRLRRMFLAVNQGDAFERANVGRLQGVGVG